MMLIMILGSLLLLSRRSSGSRSRLPRIIINIMDPHSETKARISEKTVEQLAKMEAPGIKFSNEGLSLTTEMLRIYTLEAAHRAAAQAKAEGGNQVEVEHIQKILPQLLLDFV